MADAGLASAQTVCRNRVSLRRAEARGALPGVTLRTNVVQHSAEQQLRDGLKKPVPQRGAPSSPARVPAGRNQNGDTKERVLGTPGADSPGNGRG